MSSLASSEASEVSLAATPAESLPGNIASLTESEGEEVRSSCGDIWIDGDFFGRFPP